MLLLAFVGVACLDFFFFLNNGYLLCVYIQRNLKLSKKKNTFGRFDLHAMCSQVSKGSALAKY